ncbi:ly-6/neurotoxin-like protein 1 [Seriola dumerili]|uniref:ly-6/neurotoxin-like protein 1 n=1 Tax=Seriola dumerili TaxID=41447 RepID=UPI000BBEC5E1|nr:ly-6/neurotoxin-like protein 1 [Seriola dumerili]
MKLLLTVCLTWALLYTAESLRCHTCTNNMCTTSTSVQCPATSTACRTVTSVMGTDSSTTVTVNKTCSTLLSCITPVNFATEWSVNRGFRREAHNQLCCVTDNCNLQTLATPSTLTNGKVCPACRSSAASMAGTCNTTLACVGAEDSCFSGNTTLRCTDELQLGCLTRNLCNNLPVLNALFADNTKITCGAPWSVRMSTVLLGFALTAFKVLV